MGSAPAPLRLAILEADTPQPKTQEKFGGYGGVFRALLAASAGGADELAKQATITAHDVVNDLGSYPSLDDVDALLITGSRHTSFHEDEWIRKLVDYTREAVESGRVKVLGICFGHQIIGRAMGAKVNRNPKGWEVAVTEVDLTPKGKEVLDLGNDSGKIRIQQMHSDAVLTVPEGAELIATNEACEVQGLYCPGRYVSVQGHPEFTGDIVSEILFNRHKAGIFADDMYKEAVTRAPADHDGIAIGKAFLKFLRED